MKVLLEYCFDHPSARWIYGVVAGALRLRGNEVELVRAIGERDLSTCDVFISHDVVDEHARALPRFGCWGGRALSRPALLELVCTHGLPVMPWALAANRHEVLALFERWNAVRLLLKRSGTRKGAGVCVFDREGVDRVEWQPPLDVFCPELNPDAGTVYKAEIFNGRLVIAWQWKHAPLHEGFSRYLRVDDRRRAGRRLFRFPQELDQRIRAFSTALTERGFGYCSLDVMRSQSGELVVIELNVAQVATWWTARFPHTTWRYAAAVGALVSTLAGGADRRESLGN